tara:strand:- start:242 stop:484 length:243 start_codon:yes stop_codon:yes gene_type:complete
MSKLNYIVDAAIIILFFLMFGLAGVVIASVGMFAINELAKWELRKKIKRAEERQRQLYRDNPFLDPDWAQYQQEQHNERD